jgi:hypothetical protein
MKPDEIEKMLSGTESCYDSAFCALQRMKCIPEDTVEKLLYLSAKTAMDKNLFKVDDGCMQEAQLKLSNKKYVLQAIPDIEITYQD